MSRRSVLVPLLLSIPVLATASIPSSVECTPPPAGMIGWWTGDGDAHDSSGNGQHGTLHGSVGIIPGEVNTAFNFAAAGDVVVVPHSAALEPAHVSVEAWIYPTAVDGDRYIVDKQHYGSPGGYLLDIYGGLRFLVSTSSTAGAADGPVPELDTWTHVVGTWDGHVISLYVNGELFSSTGYEGDLGSTAEPLTIGANDIIGTAEFAGAIDEPAVYDHALTEAEVQALYASGHAGKCTGCAPTSSGGRIAWYHAEGDAPNASGNGNDGTPYGGIGLEGDGKVGRGFQLDGVDDQVDIGTLPQLDDATAITVLAWVRKPDNNNFVAGIVGQWYTSPYTNNSFLLYNSESYASGQGGFVLQFTDGTFGGGIGTTQIPFDRWTLVAGTWDSTSGKVVYYRDGVAESISQVDPGKVLNHHGVPSASIGDWGYDRRDVYFWKGGIDDVQIFNRALSAAEIAAIYRAGADGTCTEECAGTVDFSAPTFAGSEKTGTALLRATRTGSLAAESTVKLAFSDETARAEVDYVAFDDVAFWFAPGESVSTLRIPGLILADDVDESPETFGVGLYDANGGYCVGAVQPAAQVKIADHTPAPVVTLSSGDVVSGEDGGTVTVTAHLSGRRGGATTILLLFNPPDLVLEHAATAKKDYRLPVDGAGKDIKSITIPDGSTEGSLVIALLPDAVDEADETLVVRVNPGQGYGFENPLAAADPSLRPKNVITIVDATPSPTVSFATAAQTFPEPANGAGDAFKTVTLKLSAASALPVSVMVGRVTGGDGDAVIETAQPVAFAPGQVAKTVTLRVIDDSIDEDNPVVTLQLSDPVNAELGANTSDAVKIKDND